MDDVDGNWYYMAFCDAYPGGRVPVLARIEFNSDGFPQSSGSSRPDQVTTLMQQNALQYKHYEDCFSGTTLSPQWE